MLAEIERAFKLSVVVVAATILSAIVLGCENNPAINPPEPPDQFALAVPRPTGDPILVGAGDIAGCSSTKDSETAELLEGISGTVFTTGDNAYERGTSTEFAECYAPTWGSHKSRTRPSPGNHDYYTPSAREYFEYFGTVAGDPSRGYYSYDLGQWHVVSLNSMCEEVGGCERTSPTLRWLKNDLDAHRRACTVAYWHHPLFSSGYHGNEAKMRPTYRLLYRKNADVVINGHDHDYERFAPQNPNGVRDRARGIREFVVGTGGTSLRAFAEIKANSQVRNANTHGVLKLTLNPTGYDWNFVPVAGKSFTDRGSDSCR